MILAVAPGITRCKCNGYTSISIIYENMYISSPNHSKEGNWTSDSDSTCSLGTQPGSGASSGGGQLTPDPGPWPPDVRESKAHILEAAQGHGQENAQKRANRMVEQTREGNKTQRKEQVRRKGLQHRRKHTDTRGKLRPETTCGLPRGCLVLGEKISSIKHVRGLSILEAQTKRGRTKVSKCRSGSIEASKVPHRKPGERQGRRNVQSTPTYLHLSSLKIRLDVITNAKSVTIAASSSGNRLQCAPLQVNENLKTNRLPVTPRASHTQQGTQERTGKQESTETEEERHTSERASQPASKQTQPNPTQPNQTKPKPKPNQPASQPTNKQTNKTRKQNKTNKQNKQTDRLTDKKTKGKLGRQANRKEALKEKNIQRMAVGRRRIHPGREEVPGQKRGVRDQDYAFIDPR